MAGPEGLPNEAINFVDDQPDDIPPVTLENIIVSGGNKAAKETEETPKAIQDVVVTPWPMEGRRRSIVLLGLYVGLFFSTLDSSIVSTALVNILDDFGNFELSPWIVLAYMLTYMSFSMVFARLSDTFGRKPMVLAAWAIFTAFSLGCGLSQTMIQLAFQGLGGAGLYSMTMVLIPEIVATDSMSMTSAIIGMTIGCSGVLGPILGGVISHYAQWKWIFLIKQSVPVGGLFAATLFLAWPRPLDCSVWSWSTLRDLDFLGILLILCASIMHVYGFEAAGSGEHDWNTPIVIALVVVAGCCWLLFFSWELLLGSWKRVKVEPIFPVRIIRRRVMAANLVSTFLTGFPFIVSIVTLPERFQIVNGASSLMAGVYLLPLLGSSAIGSFLGGALSRSRNHTPYTLVAASIFQLLGVGLLSTLGATLTTPAKQYGFEALLGFGVGLSLSSATIMTSLQARRGDLAAAQGALAQVRVLGGIIGLTIATTLFNRRSDTALANTLSVSQLAALHRSPLASLSFTPAEQIFVRSIYSGVFSLQMRVMMYVSIICVIVSAFAWERHPPSLREAMLAHRDSAGGGGTIGEDRRVIGIDYRTVAP